MVEIAPVRVELRADKAALEDDPERAGQALTLFLTVRLDSTLRAQAVETVEIAAHSGARTLAESRERDGAGFREALREALEAPRDVIAAKLPRALNGIVTLD